MIAMNPQQPEIQQPSYQELKNRLKSALSELTFLYQLLSNKELSTTQRIVLAALRRNVRQVPEEIRTKEGMTPVYLPRIADQSGVSSKTAGSAIKKMAESNIIERQIDAGQDDGSNAIHKRLLVSIHDLPHPESLELSQKRNHGGKRYHFCKDCGYRDVIIKVVCICKRCGGSHIVRQVEFSEENAYQESELLASDFANDIPFGEELAIDQQDTMIIPTISAQQS